MMDQTLKREIIMDHYQTPRNKKTITDESYKSKHMAADSCIDDITVYVKGDGHKIVDVAFDGVGCTISTASTSIMSELIKGKSYDEALAIIQEYEDMLDEKEYDEDKLEEANAFDTLSKQANRINCGLIGVKGFKEVIEELKRDEREQ